MDIYKHSNQKINILLIGLLVLGAIFFTSKIPQISYKISDIFHSAIVSKGGKAEALILVVAPIVGIIWLWLVFVKKRYLSALFLQIIIFPFTYKAQKVFAIDAYEFQIGYGYVQKISLTTFLIIILFCILLYKGVIKRPKTKEWRLFERFILIFAMILTITQFFNHSFHSAIWLSIGCIWQFVLLFYILSSLITSFDKIVNLFNALIGFTLMNILLRVFAEEQVIIQGLGGGIQRVGANAMGPAVSYGGYLVLLITICIALYRTKKKYIYLVLLCAFFVEMLQTFTRGAFLTLFLILLVVYWKQERKLLFKIIPVIILFVVLFGSTIWMYASYRGLAITRISKIDNVAIRIDLFYHYFKEIFSFSLVGNGIGKATLISGFSPHNITVEFLDSTGLIVTLIFVILFSYSLYNAFSISNKWGKINKKICTLNVYVFVALTQWFLFANTTSTSILAYYPYEASTIIWILIFMPFLLKNIAESEQFSYNKR